MSSDKADEPEPGITTNRRGTPPRYNKTGDPLFTEVSVLSKIRQDKILQTYGFKSFPLCERVKLEAMIRELFKEGLTRKL